ncbi:MAG: sensor histidine kinase [Rhodococcus sp. (in: high G+C Gram-positive bacteria)]|uniref:sensor histidine kinase n=1 Tax=Rhodococcus sp. TaxID=1831 RepID=UPI003D9BD656
MADRISVGGTAAADRLLRMFARFIAIGYVCYLLLVFGELIGQADLTAAWWTPLAVTLIFGSSAAFGFSASWSGAHRMKQFAAANAILYLVALALWFPAWNGSVVPQDHTLWFSSFPGLASFAAVVAWRPPWAFLHMVCAILLAQSADHTVRDAPFGQNLLPDVAFGLVFCTVFLAAARRAPDESVVPQAERALAELDNLRRRGDDDEMLAAHVAVSRLRTAAVESDEEVAVSACISPGDERSLLPAQPVRVIAAALGEAVRNSVRHAGPAATRSVLIDAGPGRLDVRVVDDGCGFDPDVVAQNRLGVSVSIRARMNQLSGGTADVRSVPGSGTMVSLSWREQTT